MRNPNAHLWVTRYLWITLAALALPLRALAGDDDEGLRARVRERIQEARFHALVETVGADPASARRVQEVWRGAFAKVQPLRKERMGVRKELERELSATQPEARRLSALTDRVIAIRHEIREIQEARQKEVRAILTPIQYARLILNWPAIERRIEERVRAAARGG